MFSAAVPSIAVPVSARTRAVSSYTDLSRQVRAAGLLERRLGYYWALFASLATAFVACWTAFGLLGDSWWQLLVAAALAVTVTQFGFLGHDAAHRQIFASGPWNDWTARVSSGAFAGLSFAWWSRKHNRHHAGPNQVSKDPDIADGAILFVPSLTRGKTGLRAAFIRNQGYLFFPLLTLEGINLHIAGLRTLAGDRTLPHRRLEMTLIVTRLAAEFVAVAWVLSPLKAAAFLAVQFGLFGVLLGGSFAPNHKGMPLVPKTSRLDFMTRQVLMSRNIDGGLVTDFAMGGLNYQIEHHLFPNMPRPNLRRAQPMVRAFCVQQGIPYTQTSLFTSYGIVVRYLNSVGLRERDPFVCPMTQQYRA